MSALDTDHLPPSARELAAVIGLPALLRFVEVFGGVRVYVPETLRADHPLIEVLGAEAARLLCEHYARDTIEVPRCTRAVRAARDTAIRRQYREGMSARRLALAYGGTERWIWYVLAREPSREAQASPQRQLF